MEIKDKRILCLAPHPDDIEFGCGASVDHLLKQSNEVWYVTFSPCNKSLPEGFQEYAIYEELKQSIKILGIAPDHLITHDFPVREFPKYRQEILELLVQLKKEIQPHLVFLPNKDDVHQDHHQIYLEGIRAYKHCCILGYELPWNNLSFQSNFHIKVSDSNLKSKVKAIQSYSSQKHRVYSQEAFIKGQAKVRGVQVNAPYAEAFQCVRWIL